MIDNNEKELFEINSQNNGNYSKKDEIKNEAEIELFLCGKKHTVKSNEVEAKIVEITVKKEQSCNFAFNGDEIEYKVTICNESGVNLNNVKFVDELSRELKFERESFKVDSKKETAHLNGNTLTYTIPEIKAKHHKVITFECEVCRRNDD